MSNRERILKEIETILSTINEIQERIDSIKLELEKSNENEKSLTEEKESLEEDIKEYHRDIGVLEEILQIEEINKMEDNRSSSPYEEKYDGWDEVFTGGDY